VAVVGKMLAAHLLPAGREGLAVAVRPIMQAEVLELQGRALRVELEVPLAPVAEAVPVAQEPEPQQAALVLQVLLPEVLLPERWVVTEREGRLAVPLILVTEEQVVAVVVPLLVVPAWLFLNTLLTSLLLSAQA
jgi:hypothetical protein